MISVIVCSINEVYAQKLELNIMETIGVPFELIIINNKNTGRGITAVYNEGAQKAKYEILVFVHEDVAFQTQNWGGLLQQSFEKNKDWGLIGIAGAKYKSKAYSGWYTGIKEFDCCNISHIDRTGKNQKILLQPDQHASTSQVVVIDGVFIVALKSIWEKVKFNDRLLKGFHFYDIDFSFRAALITKVVVTYEIDLLHFTEGGDFGDKWIEQAFIWQSSKVINQNSPLTLHGVAQEIDKVVERKIINTWLSFLMKQRIGFYNRMKWLHFIGSYNTITNIRSVVPFMLYRLAKSLRLLR